MKSSIQFAGRMLWSAAIIAMAAGCSWDREDSITQFSTFESVLKGIYDGEFTVAQLKQAGNFGMGTFNHLDGEMVVLDGVVYQARSNGQVEAVKDDTQLPFANVVDFQPELDAVIPPGLDFPALGLALDENLPSLNMFYAARIDANFPYIKIRTVPRQEPPYRPLTQVVQDQVISEFADMAGTLVIVRMPQFLGYLGSTGYHMHFISQDRTKAGHVLALTTPSARASIDFVSGFRMELPQNDTFLNAPLDGTAPGEKLAAVLAELW